MHKIRSRRASAHDRSVLPHVAICRASISTIVRLSASDLPWRFPAFASKSAYVGVGVNGVVEDAWDSAKSGVGFDTSNTSPSAASSGPDTPGLTTLAS